MAVGAFCGSCAMAAAVALSSHQGSSARRVGLISASGFVVLALAVLALPSVPGDEALRQWLLAATSPAVVEALRVINYAGSWRLLLPATLLILLAFPRARGRWWIWIGLMLAAPAAEGLLKIVIGRPRPEDASMGFPSGHANAAAAFFGAVIYLAGSLPSAARAFVRIGAALVIVLVAVARVVLRAHWPSDALAGIALGLAFASAAAILAGVAKHSDPAATT
jgi:membrane-associated phospholipid phosphatase